VSALAITAIIAVVSGALTAIITLLLFPSQRAKLGAEREAAQVASQVSLAGGYGELVDALREEINRLQTSLTASRNDTEACRREIVALRGQLAEFGSVLNKIKPTD
jgi:hypothetical protein